jgi:hypothetical protein
MPRRVREDAATFVPALFSQTEVPPEKFSDKLSAFTARDIPAVKDVYYPTM